MTATASTQTPAPPRVLLAHHLRQLKLPTVLREYEKVAAEAAQAAYSHSASVSSPAASAYRPRLLFTRIGSSGDVWLASAPTPPESRRAPHSPRTCCAASAPAQCSHPPSARRAQYSPSR